MKVWTVSVWGAIVLSVLASCFGQAPPPNDYFTNRIHLTGSSITFTGTLAGATAEFGEPAGGYCDPFSTVWWSWTPSENTVVTIQVLDQTVAPTCGSVELVEGPELGRLSVRGYTPMETLAGSLAIPRSFSAPVMAGEEYKIRASETGYGGGGFTLRLTATNNPILLAQPEDCSVRQYGSAMFTVTAAGVRPLYYQWQFNGTNLFCSTKPILMLQSVTTNQAGNYSVIVSNSTGVTTSRLANLVVSLTNPHPVLVALPPSSPANQDFALTGEPGRWYWVQTSEDLTNWTFEPGIVYSPSNPSYTTGLALLTNNPRVFSVPYYGRQKYLRAYLTRETEACIKNLEGIRVAKRLWAAENKRTSADPEPYGSALDPYMDIGYRCPSGGWYVFSYLTGNPHCSSEYTLGHVIMDSP